jgi:ubiquinone/menaquinone biosynthesis C-methylase UbiE
LVIGGGTTGLGIREIKKNAAIHLVESDVVLGPNTMLLCDGHDLPFADASFDGVIIQAVLEHVLDPYRCSDEIYRVLKPDGLVYAETPFMQQVHGGPYDFTRFSHLGHRRLFRRFQEVDSGAACGPGMALAWSYQYFFSSFTSSKKARWLLHAFTSFTSFYLKYFDRYLINKPGGLDAASATYFMGRKSDILLSDRELIAQYKGAV